MKTVRLTIKLQVDDSIEDIDTILQEMDYNFSYKYGRFNPDGSEYEGNLIMDQEIIEQEYE